MELESSKNSEKLLNELTDDFKKILQDQINNNKLLSSEMNDLQFKYNELKLKNETTETNISNQSKQLK